MTNLGSFAKQPSEIVPLTVDIAAELNSPSETVTACVCFGLVAGTAYFVITAATNATPIAITTSAPHGYATGQQVRITSVLGNTAANGVWTITVTGSTTFTLNGSTGSGAYTAGGRVVAVDNSILSGSATVSGSKATQKVQIGNDAINYTVNFVMTTSDGNVYEMEISLPVLEV